MSPSHSHSHSHSTSPYSRSCQSPTTTSCYSFLCAFLSALTSISLPTHITGYFLPTLKETILLWLIVGIGLVYSAICTTLFFKVLEVAVSEGYRVKEGREEEDEKRRKLRGLKGLSWMGMVGMVLLLGGSIGLFLFHLRTSEEDWERFCTTRSIIFTSSEHPIESICSSMSLNQTYLILLIPSIMLPIEGMRHFQTLGFVGLAGDTRVSEKPPRIKFEDGGLRGRIERQRELGRMRRRERKEKEPEETGSESEESRERLISV